MKILKLCLIATVISSFIATIYYIWMPREVTTNPLLQYSISGMIISIFSTLILPFINSKSESTDMKLSSLGAYIFFNPLAFILFFLSSFAIDENHHLIHNSLIAGGVLACLLAMIISSLIKSFISK